MEALHVTEYQSEILTCSIYLAFCTYYNYNILAPWGKRKGENSCYHNPRHDLCQGVNDFGKRERAT